MLLYIMLYIVLAHLMLFAALTNAVCLNNAFFLFLFFPLICANAFYFHALSLFISFFFKFASCTVLLICLFFLIICSHRCCCFLFFIFKYFL